MIFSVYNRLPANFRYGLKKLFRTAGHSRSWLDGMIARRDACGKKSLASSLTHTLHLLDCADIASLQGLQTMDFGSGYVPTDALSHWLLGAEQAWAADYNPIADFTALSAAITAADEEQLHELVPAARRDMFANRLAALRRTSPITSGRLASLGVFYLAPFDILHRTDSLAFDLITSTSVLEHIARNDIPSLLQALVGALTEKGQMVHEIHLEDHLDLSQDPFNYFRSNTTYDPAHDHDARGNRVLRSDWHRYFSALEHCSSSEHEVRFTEAARLPPRSALRPCYRDLADQELFASHVVYLTRNHAA